MKKLGIIVSLVFAFGTACQRESSFPEVTNMPVEQNEEETAVRAGKLLGQMIFDSVAYTVQPEEMLQPFIKEFDDGTVVDRAMIRKVQEGKNGKPGYYLVGIGQKSGVYRMMALELHVSGDNGLYVSPQSRKFVTSSEGCDFCLFTFTNNAIDGAECESNDDGGSGCTYATAEGNTFMQ